MSSSIGDSIPPVAQVELLMTKSRQSGHRSSRGRSASSRDRTDLPSESADEIASEESDESTDEEVDGEVVAYVEPVDEDEKVVKRGDLKYVLLRLLSEGARHGYQLLKEIEDKTQGGYRPSPGSLYPSLIALEEAGYISAEDEDERRVYHITDDGMEILLEKQERVDAVMERAGRVAGRHRPNRALLTEMDQDFNELRRTIIRRARQVDFNLEALRQVRKALENARSDILNAFDEIQYGGRGEEA